MVLSLSSIDSVASFIQGIVGSESPCDSLGKQRKRAELAPVGPAIGDKHSVSRGARGGGGERGFG